MGHHRYPHRAPPKLDLSGRERDVLRHAATGASNKEIARILGIGERTVEHHISGACKRLGVSNRLAAVVRAGILKGVGQ